MCFFIGVAIKIAVLVSWHTTSVSVCLPNDPELEIQKRCSYFKNVALDFVLLVLKLYPHPGYIPIHLTSIMDKTHRGPVFVLFSVQLQQLF